MVAEDTTNLFFIRDLITMKYFPKTEIVPINFMFKNWSPKRCAKNVSGYDGKL